MKGTGVIMKNSEHESIMPEDTVKQKRINAGKDKVKRHSKNSRKEATTAYLCLIPAFLGLTLISYLPTISVFVLSLFKWNGITDPVFVGINNYIEIFTKDIYFKDSMKATIIYALLTVVGSIVYSLLIALLLNMKIPARSFFRSVFFVPYLLPAIGVFTAWRWLYELNYGLFNYINHLLGLPTAKFLESPTQVLPSLALIAIWCSGNLIVIFLAGLQNVPRVYREAAEIDGANFWQRFRYITIPSISPIIFYNLLMALITNLQVVTPALAITDGGPQNGSMFLSYLIYVFAFTRHKVGYAAAYAAIFFVFVGLFTIILFATSKSWLFYEEEGE